MMNQESKKALFATLKTLAAIKPDSFGGHVTPQIVQMYVETLSEYDTKTVELAIAWAFKELKSFPDISDLLGRIDPKSDPTEEAGKIIEAVPAFGKYQATEARFFLGEKLWAAVQLYGGWENLCQVEIDQLGTVRAQLRDLCKSPAISNPERLSKRLEGNNGQKSITEELRLISSNFPGDVP